MSDNDTPMADSSDGRTRTPDPNNTEHNRKQENQLRRTGGNSDGGVPRISGRNGGGGFVRKPSNRHP